MVRLKKSLFIAATISFLLASCGTLSTWHIEPEDARIAQQQIPALVDRLVGEPVKLGHAPGAVVGVLLPDGSRQFFSYGSSSDATSQQSAGRRPTKKTLFAVGSLSKSFVGNIAALLVAEGRLSWQERLGDILTDVPLSEDAAQITIEDLATHRSGLPRQPMSAQMLLYFTEYLLDGENFYRNLDSKTVLAYLKDFSRPFSHEPVYSNIGYAILSHVIEQRTNKKIESLVHEHLIVPLRLQNTGYHPQRLAGFTHRAIGHAGDQPKFIRRGRPVPDWFFTDALIGSAGLWSTAEDMLLYAQENVRPSGKISPAAVADSLRLRGAGPSGAPSIAWITDEVRGVAITYQVGIVAGYTSYMGIDRAAKTAVVILQNAFNWDHSAGHQILYSLSQ